MRSKGSIDLFTGAYSLARRAKLLQIGWFRNAFVASYFLYKRLYEDPFWVLAQQKPELFANGDVLDVGANIGYTAWVFARTLKPASKVYAFEPDRYSYGLLGEVIRRKNLAGTIEALNIALGSSDGYVEFWHNEEHSADHRVATEQFRSSRPDAKEFSKVPITSVDAFVRTRNLQKISFIKIDVQGYELAVCEGMKDTLERFPEVFVCFEYSPEAMVELGFDPGKLLDFFRTKGYQLHVLTRGAIRLANDRAAIQPMLDRAGYVDLLCSKRVLT
jgi:FkbM family methyltransferase